MQKGAKSERLSGNLLYAIAVVIWIVAIWVTAFYVASTAVADESAGVGGNSFLFGCSLATAGVLTVFSVRELRGAYKALVGTDAIRPTDSNGRNENQAKEKVSMTKLGLFVALEAKAGKERHLAAFLKNALPLVEAEPKTASWFAIQMSPSKFGIFDTFSDEKGREAHLSGEVAKALMANAPDLLVRAPSIEKLEVLAEKVTARG
jgi:quinol monooxygenase YgiN